MVYLWTMNANWTKRKCSFITTNNRSENVLTQPIYFLLWKERTVSLTVHIYPNLSVCHRCCNIVPHSCSLCGKEQPIFLTISPFVFIARKNADIAELVYVQNAWGLWPANESTHAELMPPKLTEGRSGPTTVTAARCTPLACPSPHGARSDALYSHPAQTRWHSEPFLEARRDRLASLLFPQGVAFSPTTVEWNKAVGDEREQPTQLLGGKGSGVSFYGMLPWLASSFSIIISIICYDTSCGLLIKRRLFFFPFLSNLHWSTIPQSRHVTTVLCTNSSKTNGGCR